MGPASVRDANLEDKAIPWQLTGNAIASGDFLGTTNDQLLVIRANNLEAMRIEPDGKVGIGTTSPYHTLQVGGGYDGNLGFDGSDGTPNAGYIRFGDNTGWQLHFTRQREQGGGAPLNTGTTGALMTIQDNGNVGIGTTSPLHMLQVGGGFDGNLGLDGSDGSPNAGYIRFGDTTGWKLHFTRQRETSGGDLNTGATGALVTIQDNGNVGIGTTFPGFPLDVPGDARIAGVLWGNHGNFSNDVNATRIQS
jgi:hypothetical protein